MTSIFVAKLDFGVTSEELKSAFEQYGKVLKASVATDRETGKSRGFAFVEMADATEAKNAISALDNFHFNGRPITVKEAEPRENRPTREQGSRPPFSGNGEKKPFQRTERPERPERTETTKQAPVVLNPEDFLNKPSSFNKSPDKDKNKGEQRKKKNGSMQAYKKSGKTPRYDLDDDDFDDWRPSGGKRNNIQFEDDEDGY